MPPSSNRGVWMRAVVVGYYGFGNSGDEALLLTLMQQLPESVEPVVLSNDPARTAELYGVETCDRWNLRNIHRLFRSADAFIWGGGSLMQDSSSWRNPLYYGGLMRWAQMYELTTIAWGQGIGPLQRGWVRWLTRSCLQRCESVSVRDEGAARLLQTWGIAHKLAPDPVWSLSATDYQPDWESPAIAVVLRHHPLLTPARLNTIQRALDILQAQTNAQLLLMPFQATDVDLAQSMQGACQASSRVVRIEDPRQLMAAFGSVKLAIAMRLHGLILAAAAGIPVFGLSYDPKVKLLMEAEQIPGYELEQLPEDERELAEAWLKQYRREGLSAIELGALRERAAIHADCLRNGLSKI
ncbi:MAG: polysaccharide pyruvyl transferase CsaB [Cyanobacteria bacterium P01_A01_bin.3]